METLSIIAYSQPITRAEIEQIRGFRRVKGLVGCNLDVGIDFCDPLRRNVNFVLPDRFACGIDLPVYIGQADLVVVDQIDRADPGAYQRLNRVTAYAADPEHCHTRPPQPFHSLLAKQKLRS